MIVETPCGETTHREGRDTNPGLPPKGVAAEATVRVKHPMRERAILD
jgi:hypothetical protein